MQPRSILDKATKRLGRVLKQRPLLYSTIAAAVILVSTNTVIAAPIFDLRFYNVDDVMNASITNAAFADQGVLQANFLQDTGFVDISSFVRPGQNDLFLTDLNTIEGWTYGYDFRIDGVTYASDVCGTADIMGCEHDDATPGIVFSRDIGFNVPTEPVPEPGTLLLIFGGLIGMAGLRRLRA
jgi:hypothetical protein